jgi:C-terminal processing protease CtpA/Prc
MINNGHTMINFFYRQDFKTHNMRRIRIFALIFANLIIFAGCHQESRKVRNIETFAKIYGYARWFHPSDEAAEIDWDKFAILGLRKVENAQSDEALRDTLLNLFSPIVQGLQIYKTGEIRKEIINSLQPPDSFANKIVTWQHYGVYLGEESSIYNSLRTNRVKRNWPSAIQYEVFDVSPIQGKEVKVSGYFKKVTSDSTGKAYLFCYPFNYEENPWSNSTLLQKGAVEITSEEWRKYEITINIDENIEFTLFGCTIEGNMELSADDFSLSVKNGNKWEALDLDNLGFEGGREKTRFDWDFDQKGHNIQIEEGDAYTGRNYTKVNYTGKIFDEMPAFGETIREPIGSNLTCCMPVALKEYNGHTFPVSDPKKLEMLKEQISGISITRGFDMDVNLASVIIAWNVFQHFYPYFDVIETNWKEVLGETIEKTYLNKTQSDFFVTISEMVAELDDGHGVVSGEKMYHLPVRTEEIENKIVITASQDSLLHKGDIILSIDNIKTANILEKTMQRISGSRQLKKHRALNIFGSSFREEKTRIEIERDAQIYTFEVQNVLGIKGLFFNDINDLPAFPDTIKELEPGILYINCSKCDIKQFKENLRKIESAKSIIYDNRWGGNLDFFQVISHWTANKIFSPKLYIPMIIYPDQKNFRYDERDWSIEPETPLFRSKNIILTAPNVVSMGETEMGFINHHKLGTTVGKTTAGCNGNANFIFLPCGYEVMWTGMKVLKQDGSQHHLIGFIPDYPVERTLQGFKEGRDEALEKAMEIARE